jgi:hypothetical protein
MKATRAITLILFLSCVFAQSICFCQGQATRDDILRDVRKTARRHVESGAGKDSKYVVHLWDPNSAGVTRQEILRTYDEEFTKAKTEHDKKDWVPKAGWIVAGLLLVGLVFLDRLKQALGKFIDFTGEKLFTFFAGMPWFYRLALNRYRERVIDRHSKLKIPFRPERPLDLSAIFVPLKMTDTPEASDTIDAYAALARNSKMVVKGAPGSGKSILLRHIALTCAQRRHSALIRNGVPILVELNRLNDPVVNLRSELARELRTKGFPSPDCFLSRGLKHGSLLLLLDGLDEISAAQRPGVVQQIRDLMEEFPRLRLLVSCRTQVYNGELDAFVDKVLEIQDFSDQQIRRFLRSWAPDMRMHGKSVDQLVRALLERPAIMLLARNPLMLTIIAWLYTDTTVILPHSRSEFYRKATELLLYDWKPDSNAFQLVPKQLVLRDLALYFQDSADQRQQDRRSVEIREVLQRIGGVLPSLNLDSQESAMPLLNEIVQRSGLLLAIDGGERYQFAHLTLQEYFAAAALRSDPDGLIARFNHDPDAWREPVKLWCGLDEDATKFVQAVHQTDPITGFECLADAQKVRSEIATQIIDSMKKVFLSEKPDPALAKAFGSVASSLSDRGKAVFKWLSEQEAPQALEALSYTNMPQAAKIMASLYTTTAAVRPLLCRFGELAVLDLRSLAEAGCASAVDDLLTIGTPGAAEALAPLLWHNSSEIAGRAAFAIAALFQSPEAFAALGDVKVDHPQEAEWVWQPFETHEQTAIPVIAGRVASLLLSAHELADLPDAKLDPRLLLPVCAETGNELTVVGSLKDFRQLSIAELHQRLTSPPDGSKAQAETAGRLSVEILETITLALFDRLRPSPRWQFLFRHLELPIRAELVRGISSTRLPNREDWGNIFRPVSYTARRGWHLWLTIAVTTAVATGDMIYLLAFRRPFATSAVLLSVVLLLGTILQLGTMIFGYEDEDPSGDLGLFAESISIVFRKDWKWRDLITKSGTALATIRDTGLFLVFSVVIILWLPVWITSSFLAADKWLGHTATAAAIALLLAGMGSLWRRARRLHRLSRNPLSGLQRFLRPGRTDAEASEMPAPLTVTAAASADN